MASEKVRTGMELEIFVMGQCSKRLEGMSVPAKIRVLNHLMASAQEEISGRLGVAISVSPDGESQQEMFGAQAE